MKLNLGCGLDYKEGWVNVDFNKEIKADVYCDINKKLPFKTNTVTEILLDNTLEHMKAENFFNVMEDLWRVCEDGGMIKIYAPHFTGTAAFKHPAHYKFFGVGTFGSMKDIETEEVRAGERYNKARFKIVKEEIQLLCHTSQNFAWVYWFTVPFNWFFNLGGERWKVFWEKFNIFGFEQIEYWLEVRK